MTAPGRPWPLPGREWVTDGSGPMGRLLQDLAEVAPSRLPVLITGPTGSGKELAARHLHRLSGRSGPLVAVNASALADGLLESELFGHVRGAFTGATRDRRGALEEAQGGTLFLDEVAELGPRVQALLLRVLQEREIRRVGGDRTVKVDVRFAAATHRDLPALAAAGAFRQDLLFRLQGALLRVPGLDERRAEFPHLVPGLVELLAREAGLPAPRCHPSLAPALAAREWPGHVRELRHVLARALLRCRDGVLAPAHLPGPDRPDPAGSRSWTEATRAFQCGLLREALERHAYHVGPAAEDLGLARAALYATARRLGLDLPALRRAWSRRPEG